MPSIQDIIKNPNTSFIDVRSEMEFEQDHIPGAINIPLEYIPSRAKELEAIEGPIVLYCRSGNRSGMALSILKQNIQADLYNGGGLYDVKHFLN